MMMAGTRPRLPACQSTFFSGTRSVATLHAAAAPAALNSRKLTVQVQSLRECQLTGAKANNGYLVSFSHIRTKSKQHVNLFNKRVYWPERKRWVKLRISAKALKTIEKNGLQATAKEAGLDLSKLPYEDVRKKRVEWLAQQPKHPPQPKKKLGKATRMKNPKKLAASKKQPNVARYFMGGRTVISRDPKYVEDYRD
ncbi:hypothetical protein WJX73_006625 [Symbiochloris irregularis]|uniref:Large ribosomal subunit protein bL28c n=1 Tax=Symbiochloris irregularis TaxID=706552 RepID=A0AAW1NWS7_9CHLO